MIGTKVLPIPDKVTGDSYVWHFTLLNAGWNELPPEKKHGYVEYFSSSPIIVDVYWPGLDLSTTGIFLDELKPAEEYKDG